MRQKSSTGKPAPKVFSRPAPAPKPFRPGIRPSLFYGMFSLLCATNVAALVGLLMAPDISALLGGQNDMVVSAYEDRIAQLRVEVDRLHSRQFAQAGDMNLQLQELTQQQELLLEQQQLVRKLAAKATEMGIEAASVGTDEASNPISTSVSSSSDLEAIGGAMTEMMQESRLALAALGGTATASTETILDALDDLGIRPNMPEALEDAVGGPFLPEAIGTDSVNIVDDANQVYLALARLKAARSAIDLAPVHKPMDSLVRLSSTFGNRKDPFSGGRAFHSGLDYPSPTGTIVLSAGYGKVTFAAERSSYGNLVEITHSTGLVTRYAHLSAFLVKEGQIVNAGTPIAKVGSTGRSTGPHLHFEVRKKDVAVDPAKYLAVGKQLARFLGA